VYDVRTVLLNIPTNILLTVLVSSTGLTVFAYFASSRCDPLANNDIDNANQVIILFQFYSFSCDDY